MSDNGHSDVSAYFQGLFDRAIGRIKGFRPEHFIPHPDTVLVRVLPPESKTSGGLHIPDLAQAERRIGVVMAVHPSQKHDPALSQWREFPYQPGDTVFFRSYAGEKLPFDGHDDLFVLQYRRGADTDILGRFDEAVVDLAAAEA